MRNEQNEQNERDARLRALVAELDSLIRNPTAENSIVPGNGYDESMLIGSPDSYLRLAKVLIEIVNNSGNRPSWADNDLDEELIEGVPVIGTNRIKEVFREFSPVWLMCAYLAPGEKAAEALSKKLSELVNE